MKRKKKEDDLRRRNDRWEDEDMVVRREALIIQRVVPSKKGTVSTRLMYPGCRDTVRVIRIMTVSAPNGITLSLMSHALLIFGVTTEGGTKRMTLPLLEW